MAKKDDYGGGRRGTLNTCTFKSPTTQPTAKQPTIISGKTGGEITVLCTGGKGRLFESLDLKFRGSKVPQGDYKCPK